MKEYNNFEILAFYLIYDAGMGKSMVVNKLMAMGLDKKDADKTYIIAKNGSYAKYCGK